MRIRKIITVLTCLYTFACAPLYSNEEMQRARIIKELITKEQEQSRLQILKIELLIELTRLEKIYLSSIDGWKHQLRCLDNLDRDVKPDEYTRIKKYIANFSSLLQKVRNMLPLTE